MMERVRHHDHRFKPYEKRVQISCNAQFPTRTVAKALPFAPSAEPTLTQFAQTAKPSLAEETTTMDQVSTSPSTPPRTVTLAAIQTARAAFEQRVREAAATDDGLPLDDIVIASPVTRRQLDRVPDHWLYGIRVMLRADGALVITKLATQQHERACGELGWQLGTYARGNAMVAQPTLPLTLPDGSVVTPDVQIFRPETDQNPIPVPLALFEVEVHHRCTPKMIETAFDYLHQLPSVVQVVFLKYFPPRQPALEANELRVPAMLLVFRRASGANAGLIEVAQMCSFGNKRIHGTVVRNLARPSRYHVPYTVTEQQRAAADWLPDAFTLDNLLRELSQLLAQPNHAMFYVDMPQGLPPIPVDLVSEFVEAMRGWRRDRAVPTRRSLCLAAP